MPRQNPISQREKDIGARARQARVAAGFNRVEMAKRVGIDANRLASYEHGRNPLPYWIGAKIAFETDSCQRWLATGELPQKPWIDVAKAVAEVVPASMPFSFVYHAVLRNEFERLLKSIASVARQKIEDLEPHFFAHWAPILATPIEEYQVACMLQIQRASLASRGMPKDQLVAFTKKLSAVVDALPGERQSVKTSLEARRSEETEEHAMLKEYLVVKLRDFLAVMIEAKEEEERGEALAPGKPRRSAAERAVKK